MPKTVFISWSGQRSGYIAKALQQWLSEIFRPEDLQIWLSLAEKGTGNRWLTEISKMLEEANFGILCLTPENLKQPWIHFEAGAISKAVGSSRVCPYLYDVEVSLLQQSPLGQFQAVKAHKEGTKDLVVALHGCLDTPVFPHLVMEDVFEAMWLKLEDRLSKTPPLSAVQLSERSDREILQDIFEFIRGVEVRKYLDELSQPIANRSLGRDELPTALNTVVRWVLQKLDLEYTRGSFVDYEIVIGEQTVLIESKSGNLRNLAYLQATLDQVNEARDESTSKSNASAIIVIPDYPDDVADELNSKPLLDRLQFSPVTKLEKHLSDMKQDTVNQDTVNVELTLNYDFYSFYTEEKARVLHRLKELLDLQGEIPVVSIKRGSTKLIITLSREQAEQLFWLCERGVLDELNIKDARIIGSAAANAIVRNKAQSNSYDVFMCHNSEEKTEVKRIALRLRSRSILPWLDEWELRPGLPWQQVLEEHIGSIKSAAVFVGNSGVGPWAHMELDAFIRQFVQRHCPVIPVLLQTCACVPTLPPFLNGMTWVNFKKRKPNPYDQLVWGITGRKLGP